MNHHCYDAPVVVAPKRGTAIMWYNHYLDEGGKWLGAMDEQSLHGGCEVRKGVKWAANNWITAPQLDTVHQTSKYVKRKQDDHDDEEEQWEKEGEKEEKEETEKKKEEIEKKKDDEMEEKEVEVDDAEEKEKQ